MHQDNVYVSSFNWGWEPENVSDVEFIFGACHCIDLPFLFGSLDREETWKGFGPMFNSFSDVNLTGRTKLSDAMVSYLAQFMRTGNPNRADSNNPEWECWSNHAGGPKALEFDSDNDSPLIAMSTEELSIAGVRQALDGEATDIRHHVLEVIKFFQPFSLYELGEYEHGSGR